MMNRSLIVLCLALVALGSNQYCCKGDESDAAPNSVKPAKLDDFIKLELGTLREGVDELLLTPGQHEFTYLDSKGDTYETRLYTVAPSGSEYNAPLYLILKNDRLFSVVHPAREKEHFQKLSQITSPDDAVSFDEEEYLKEFLRINSSLTADSDSIHKLKARVQKEAKDYEQAMKRHRPNPLPAGAAKVLSSTAFQSRLDEELKKNAQDKIQFDPAKIKIGITEVAVRQQFGPPRFSSNSNGTHVCLYGPEKLSGVNPVNLVSPVMVTYRDDSVVKILSHLYFAKPWRERMWPSKRQSGKAVDPPRKGVE